MLTNHLTLTISMGSEMLQPEEVASTASTEVEFALVLLRMIDTVKSDPQHLRATAYELARHKLKKQLGTEAPADKRFL